MVPGDSPVDAVGSWPYVSMGSVGCHRCLYDRAYLDPLDPIEMAPAFAFDAENSPNGGHPYATVTASLALLPLVPPGTKPQGAARPAMYPIDRDLLVLERTDSTTCIDAFYMDSNRFVFGGGHAFTRVGGFPPSPSCLPPTTPMALSARCPTTSSQTNAPAIIRIPHMTCLAPLIRPDMSYPGFVAQYASVMVRYKGTGGFDVANIDTRVGECVVEPVVVFVMTPDDGQMEYPELQWKFAIHLTPIIVASHFRFIHMCRSLGRMIPGPFESRVRAGVYTAQMANISCQINSEALTKIGINVDSALKLVGEYETWRGLMIGMCFDIDQFIYFIGVNRICGHYVYTIMNLLEKLGWHQEFFSECRVDLNIDQLWIQKKCELMSVSVVNTYINKSIGIYE